MKGQPNRLSAESASTFSTQTIDRSQPLHFRLNGHKVHGFHGDTVLSAALASGIDTVGHRRGAAIALSSRHAPAVVPAGRGRPAQALPMERTPAIGGIDYVTLPRGRNGSPLTSLLRPEHASLGIDLDKTGSMPRPWLSSPPETHTETDLLVVGGGIAGMTAALTAARYGHTVMLVEAGQKLGGVADYFGSQDAEEKPAAAIARLTEAIGKAPQISVLTSSEVFVLRPGIAHLHHVQVVEGVPTGRVVAVRSPRIVLATGALERLPIFPGNRLPGVVGSVEAFCLARDHAVWPGQTALLFAGSNPAYRLAMLAKDAGIAVARLLDPRSSPQSRFIEFSKAYGITLAASTIVAGAVPARRGLAVETTAALQEVSRQDPAWLVDRLILCGGWQPNLTLWHMAGGESAWSAGSNRLEPKGALAGVALAGSVAGWQGNRACIASGADAVNQLFERKREAVADILIDALHETPDAPTSIGNAPDAQSMPGYLDGGFSLIERPRRASSRWRGWLSIGGRKAAWSLGDTPKPLDVADIAAGVQLGAIPAESAGIVAQERVGMVAIATQRVRSDIEATERPLPPDYLRGRFSGGELWLIAPDEPRSLAVGALLYEQAEETDPLKAIGAVVRAEQGNTLALVAGSEGQRVFVSEAGRAFAARLITAHALR